MGILFALSRRQLLQFSAIAPVAGIVANCGGGLTAPQPVTIAPPQTETVADYLKGIADGVLGAAADWGLSPAALAKLQSGAQTLESIAGKVSVALAAGGTIATLAEEALPVVEAIVSFIPGGSAATGILTAIQTLAPIVAAAAGKRMAARPTGMSPAVALDTLRRAARRV